MSAELIILGRIATLAGESGFGWAEGLAIEADRVVAVGSASQLEGLRGPGTRTWSLGKRRVVIPGLTDAHLHLAAAALAESELDLSDAPDRPAIERSISEVHDRMIAEGDGAGWLLGHGWSRDRLGDWPTAADLDRLAPGRPCALWSHDHHGRWASSAALAAAGIGVDTSDPEGGLIRRDEDARPTGMLHEHAAKLLAPAIPEVSLAVREQALQVYAARLAALGVVAAHDPGELADEPELSRGPVFYAGLATAGRLVMRVSASVRPEQTVASHRAGAEERRNRGGR